MVEKERKKNNGKKNYTPFFYTPILSLIKSERKKEKHTYIKTKILGFVTSREIKVKNNILTSSKTE